MDQVFNVVPDVSDDILKLHILYLEKLDKLSKGEREAYERYFIFLSHPMHEVRDEVLHPLE
jgi:hypothetical protein